VYTLFVALCMSESFASVNHVLMESDFRDWNCSVDLEYDKTIFAKKRKITIPKTDNRNSFQELNSTTGYEITFTLSYRPNGFFEWVPAQGLGDSKGLDFSVYVQIRHQGDYRFHEDLFSDAMYVPHRQRKFKFKKELALVNHSNKVVILAVACSRK